MNRRRRDIASVALFALAVVALACGGESTRPVEPPVVPLRLVAVPAGDTVGAFLTQPLVVEVREPGVAAVVFRANMVENPVTGPEPGVRLSRTPDGQALALVDTVAIDTEGRASVYLRLGTLATDAVVTVLAPATRDSVQARITVRPGAPTRLVASPADTALYVGHSYPLEARLFDTYDNPIVINGLTFTTDSASVAITEDGNVTGLEIGRAGIVAHVGPLDDTVWASVVPEGRIAAAEYGGSGGEDVAVVLINLDGSDYRRFPLGQFDIPRPAWHPSGAYLVASIHAAPGASDLAPRLAALDTSTGEWRAIGGGTPDAAGDGHAQFSHDGAWIYVANAPTSVAVSSWGSSVYRVRADGSGDAEVVGYDNTTDASEIFDHPSPSPDGSRIAMTVGGSSGTYTLIVPASPPLGEVPQQAELLDGLPTGGYPTWSPVGEDILMFGTEGMWIMRAGAQSIDDRRYLALGWSTPANITGGFSGASWSPDGRWIVARAHAGMILVDVATDRVLPLALGSLLSSPAWRPR